MEKTFNLNQLLPFLKKIPLFCSGENTRLLMDVSSFDRKKYYIIGIFFIIYSLYAVMIADYAVKEMFSLSPSIPFKGLTLFIGLSVFFILRGLQYFSPPRPESDKSKNRDKNRFTTVLLTMLVLSIVLALPFLHTIYKDNIKYYWNEEWKEEKNTIISNWISLGDNEIYKIEETDIKELIFYVEDFLKKYNYEDSEINEEINQRLSNINYIKNSKYPDEQYSDISYFIEQFLMYLDSELKMPSLNNQYKIMFTNLSSGNRIGVFVTLYLFAFISICPMLYKRLKKRDLYDKLVEIDRERKMEIKRLEDRAILDRYQKPLEKTDSIEGEKNYRNKELQEELNHLNSLIKSDSKNIDYWHRKVGILKELGDERQFIGALQQLNKLEKQRTFNENLKKHFIIKCLEVQDLDFFGTFTWNLAPQINVLLGKNGYGKSHLLTLIVALLQNNKEIAIDFINDESLPGSSASLRLDCNGKDQLIQYSKLGFEKDIGKIPVLAISELRSFDKSKETVGKKESEVQTDLKEYGSYHFLYHKSLGALLENFTNGLCRKYFQNRKEGFNLPIFQLFSSLIGQLTENEFRFVSIEAAGISEEYKIEVITEGNDKALPLQKVSQGTLSIMAIINLIYHFLESVFPDAYESELLEKHAIVFIDEIDAHTHPVWQQKIVSMLRDNFPNIQFILASHSPLVVAGCKEGEVTVLRKSKKGFKLQQIDQHMIGLNASELYRIIFEVEEKDSLYLKYSAMYPFRDRIEKEIEKLEQKQTLDPSDQERFNTLYQKQESGSMQETKEVEDIIPLTDAEKIELDQLYNKQLLNTEDEKRLNKLYEDIYYLSEFEKIEKKRDKYKNLEEENRRLELELSKIKRETNNLKSGLNSKYEK